MEYGKIIAVTGMPGLFELLTSKSDGAIVRSLDDKSTKFVSSRVHNFSHLESIEVFTVKDNVNLAEVFQAMEANADKLPDGKDGKILKSYFEKVFPDLDFERVYSSDLKKMVKWYGVLKDNDVEIKVRTAEEAEDTDGNTAESSENGSDATEVSPVDTAPEVETDEAAPKKSAKKKAAPKASTTAEEPAEKPVKKAAKKKKSEE